LLAFREDLIQLASGHWRRLSRCFRPCRILRSVNGVRVNPPTLISVIGWRPSGHHGLVFVVRLGSALVKLLEAWILLFLFYIALCHKAQFSPYTDRNPKVGLRGILAINYSSSARERRPRIALVIRALEGRVSSVRRHAVYVEESVFIPFEHGCVVSQLTCQSVAFCRINWEDLAPFSARKIPKIRGRDYHGKGLGLDNSRGAI